jgi:hypothetical protein
MESSAFRAQISLNQFRLDFRKGTLICGGTMRWYRIAAALVCGGTALAGCREQKLVIREYPVAIAEAMRRLDDADNAGFRYHRHCGVLFDFGSFQSDDHTVTWTARTAGKDVLSFTVSVLASPKGVTTTVSVERADNGREMYDGTQSYNHPILRQPLRPAVTELINAAMEKRPFDHLRIPVKDRYMDTSPSRQACSEDTQIMAQGFPANYFDRAGPSIETVQKLAAKNNWPKN